jgi:hypothetical protein
MPNTTSVTEYSWFSARKANFTGVTGATLEIDIEECRFGFFYLKLEQ